LQTELGDKHIEYIMEHLYFQNLFVYLMFDIFKNFNINLKFLDNTKECYEKINNEPIIYITDIIHDCSYIMSMMEDELEKNLNSITNKIYIVSAYCYIEAQKEIKNFNNYSSKFIFQTEYINDISKIENIKNLNLNLVDYIYEKFKIEKLFCPICVNYYVNSTYHENLTFTIFYNKIIK